MAVVVSRLALGFFSEEVAVAVVVVVNARTCAAAECEVRATKYFPRCWFRDVTCVERKC